MEPIRYEYGVPIYSKSQIDLWGLPDNYGVWK